MKKEISLMMVALWCISLASAATLVITPSSFELRGMPGETLQRNITITTDGNYAVYINGSNLHNITVNVTTPRVVETQVNTTVYFTLPTDIPPGTYKVDLKSEMHFQLDKIPDPIQSSGGSGGGGGGGGTFAYPPRKKETQSPFDLRNDSSWGKLQSISIEAMERGAEIYLRKDRGVTFKIPGDYLGHTVGIHNVGTKQTVRYATFFIASEPIFYDMMIGDIADFDLNDDCVLDIRILLYDITQDEVVNFGLKTISEKDISPRCEGEANTSQDGISLKDSVGIFILSFLAFSLLFYAIWLLARRNRRNRDHP